MRAKTVGINNIVTEENFKKYYEEWKKIEIYAQYGQTTPQEYMLMRLRQDLKADVEKVFWNNPTALKMVIEGDL